jgi:hypothetical protein
MTAHDVTDFIAQRGDAISRDDFVRVNNMLAELPTEGASDVRAWVMEGLWLTVADPLYDGDLKLSDLDR